MFIYQSNHLWFFGVLFCKRGGLPLLAFLKELHSFASSSIADSLHITLLYRKCVTFINFERFLWSHTLERIELSLLPIYTTVALYSSSYAPGSLGAFWVVALSKGYNLLLVSGIIASLRTATLQPCYNIIVTAGGLEPPWQLASGCQDRHVCQFHHAVNLENLEGESLPAETPSKSPINNNTTNCG